jgi:DnaJ-class molecular chaperone
MKKKILITIGIVALTVSAYAATRCQFCNGTGFGDKGRSSFTCSFCKGTGHN